MYQKIHIFNFIIIISCISAHFWKHCTYWFNFFIIFVTNNLFKTIFNKRNLVRYCYSVNIYTHLHSSHLHYLHIYTVYVYWAFGIVKFEFFIFNKLYKFFVHILFVIKKIISHSGPLFSLKSAFFKNHITSIMLIPLMI